jgi:ADP-ribosylglycohydrolase
MIGAVVGDVVGSAYERRTTKDKNFHMFRTSSRVTDDSVLTFAQMDYLLNGGDWAGTLKNWARNYPNAGYGQRFIEWAFGDTIRPYGSYGNGSAMRVSPVAWAFENEEEVLEAARESAAATHSHEEGIRGAQATALAIFLARKGYTKDQIRDRLEEEFGYDLSRTVEEIRPDYRWDVTCQGSVPESLISFLDSENYEDAIRNAVSLGGDADTMACIAGAVAEAFYGEVPEDLLKFGFSKMDDLQRKTLTEFYEKFVNNR